MSAEMLLDLSAIDLDRILLDARGVARFNPHRGQAVQIDAVIWHDETEDIAVAYKDVRHDEFWVPGHIPGHPIMPGVLMVEAGAQLASYMYYKRSKSTWFAGFTRIDDTTFRANVCPGDRLYIISKALKYSFKRFVSRVQGVVDGRVVFESTVSGMAFPKMGEVRENEGAEAAAADALRG